MNKLFLSTFLVTTFFQEGKTQTTNTAPLPTGITTIGNHLSVGQGNEVWTNANDLYFNYRGNAAKTYFWNKGGITGFPIMTLDNTGKVIIPSNNILRFGDPYSTTEGSYSISSAKSSKNTYCDINGNLYFRKVKGLTNGGATLGIQSDGTVTIGVWEKYDNTVANTQGNKLMVNGGILCEKVKVILDVPNSDHVFEKKYPLMPLNEVKSYIELNKHLPEIPSAQEFKDNGYSIGEMDDLLLRKVEELTLYVIQLKEELEQLKAEKK